MPEAETDYLLPDEDDVPAEPETLGQRVRGESLERVERRHRIINLRRMGMTYEAISMALQKEDPPLEVSPETARIVVHRYLETIAKEDLESVEQLRALENERLDVMERQLAPKIRRGSLPAIRTALSVMDRRARLNGLDAAHKVDVSGRVTISPGEVADPEEVKRHEQAFQATADLELPSDEVESDEAASD